MSLQENTPSGELGAKDFGKLDCQIDSTFDAEDAIEALESKVAEKREAVSEWNERVAAFRDKTEKPLPVSAFKNHPAYGDLVPILKCIFLGATEEEASEHVAKTLSKISVPEGGAILFDGKSREVFQAWMDAADRTRKVASERGDIATCALADQNLEWGSHLDFLFWDDGVAPSLPVTVAIREARYD